MVIHSLDAKFVLNICIPAKVSTVNVVANRNDVYDGRAVIQMKRINERSEKDLPSQWKKNIEDLLPMLKENTPKERGQLSCSPQYFACEKLSHSRMIRLGCNGGQKVKSVRDMHMCSESLQFTARIEDV